MTGTITLRRRGAKLLRDWRFLAMLVVLFLIVIAIPFAAVEPSEYQSLYDELTEDDPYGFLKIIALAVGAIVIGPVLVRLGTAGRIEIRESGIAFRSELPELLQAFQPDWDYTWGQIQDAKFVRPMLTNPMLLQLTFGAGGRTVTLIPWQWIEADSEDGGFAQVFSTVRKQSREVEKLIRQSPLVKAFELHNKLDADAPVSPPAPPEGINASKAAQALVVVFVGLVLYFIIDMYFGFGEYYAGVTPWHMFAAAALCGLGLAAIMLHVAGHLSSQGKLMAMLFGVGAGLASYPFLLRVNAWTDPVGLQSYSYTLGDGDTWAAEADVPDLVFDIGSDYWDQFEPGDTKSFELRFGGLGFYQVNMLPVYAEQRAYYASR